MKYLTNIGNIALRELDIIIRKNRIYGFCMVVFPVLLVVFFTTMLDDGVALDLPVGVVDQDNSATSRGLIRNLDAMQSSRVVYRFAIFRVLVGDAAEGLAVGAKRKGVTILTIDENHLVALYLVFSLLKFWCRRDIHLEGLTLEPPDIKLLQGFLWTISLSNSAVSS